MINEDLIDEDSLLNEVDFQSTQLSCLLYYCFIIAYIFIFIYKHLYIIFRFQLQFER